MSKLLIEDLRIRVIALIESGKKIEEVVELFDISEITIKRWVKLKAKTGSVAASKGYQKGHSHKITDLKEFENFVLANKNDSLEVLAKKMGNISDTTIGRWMKKISFFKKKTFGYKERDENKRKKCFD